MDTKKVAVYHGDELIGYANVKGKGNDRYIEITAVTFSPYGYAFFALQYHPNNTGMSGGKLYFTLDKNPVGERNAAYARLMADENYTDRFKVVVTLTWTQTDANGLAMTIEQNFIYARNYIDFILESNGTQRFTASVSGVTGAATIQPKYIISDDSGNEMFTLTGPEYVTTDGTVWSKK